MISVDFGVLLEISVFLARIYDIEIELRYIWLNIWI